MKRICHRKKGTRRLGGYCWIIAKTFGRLSLLWSKEMHSPRLAELYVCSFWLVDNDFIDVLYLDQLERDT